MAYIKKVKVIDPNGRKCVLCDEFKAWSKFYKGKGLNGHIGTCKDCKIKKSLQWANNNIERFKYLQAKWKKDNQDRVKESQERWKKDNQGYSCSGQNEAVKISDSFPALDFLVSIGSLTEDNEGYAVTECTYGECKKHSGQRDGRSRSDISILTETVQICIVQMNARKSVQLIESMG